MRMIDADEAKAVVRRLEKKVPWSTRSVLLLLDATPTITQPAITPRPNDPLTLEELREMDGEPVWVEHYNGGEWVIVSWNIYDEIAYTQKARLSSYNYGLSDSPGWIAYRRKPEED